MSRITPPVTKFTHQLQSIRRISSSATAAHSNILDSQVRSSVYLPRKLSDLKAECSKRALQTTGSKSELISRLSAHDTIIRSQHTTSGHRPLTSSIKTIPLMQGFRTSAPRAAVPRTPPIDYFILPSFPQPVQEVTPALRVPLLPDNYSTTHSASAPEASDPALPKAEINIVAAHPDNQRADGGGGE
ncbi:SAP domain containing protein [Rutstroemia sp. NJR-2017a BBW]|nr:SAP domain containing protein [Rutstroemia sp. NJR-2017a BBW]